jgi:NAD(P)-dependent dehydrogenase (short-subunit alcohol dehydrogenase family)
MNIVVIGPGTNPLRFGTYFVNQAETRGHTVTKFSYRLANDSGANESAETIAEKFVETISHLDKIDLLLYNCIGGGYPGQSEHFQSNHEVDYAEWQMGILINAAMPHMFSTKCLEKMDESSSIVFMTSSASYLINRDNYLQMAGYFGTKGVMNHLARALAEYNDKKATVSIIAPHIPYDEPDTAIVIMDSLTNRILNLTKEDNGKILQCYPPDGNIFYHEGGKWA